MSKKVAVIACSYRLPESDTDSLWGNLASGRNLITQVAADRWSQEAYLHPDSQHPGTSYSFAAGSIGDIEGFDAGFFGISPREATHMDPQQRLLLELTWEAFENAGIPPQQVKGSHSAVTIGVSTTDYAYRLTDDLSSVDTSTASGNAASILANRLSYFFDLKGPSMIVDTACSSSLVAFHQGCQTILSGQTDLAITGGINLHLHPYGFLTFSKANMLSPTGRCHVFDASADGYVRSEGAGIFILKDYAQALTDNNPILAVVAGSAVNTDGQKTSMTVPCTKSQAELIRQACAQTGIEPDDFDYFEAHGTGTPVGDPIETEAIGIALGRHRQTPLPIGSVKSNLGHLEAAAGVAGLAKALLTLENRCIPPTIGLQKPNPNIKFTEWNLEVVTAPRKIAKTGPLTVGINSFGFGGANAHVVLQSSPGPPAQKHAICRQALPLPFFVSGQTSEALQENARQLADLFSIQRETPLYDVAYSTRHHRQQLRHSALIEANSAEAVIGRLKTLATAENLSQLNAAGISLQQRVENPHGPVFVYTGNGCQWEQMGKQLIENDPAFLRSVDAVDRYFIPLAGYSLVAELAGGNGKNRFAQTEHAQPALFALQVGITQKLRKEGILPKAVLGHSVGEIAAAWAAGALSLPDAVKVIYYRSYHQGKTRGQGQMTAVALPADHLQTLLTEPRFASLCLAGINSPRGCTIAGPVASLNIFEEELKKNSIAHKRLDLEYAFHSAFMDELETGIRQDLANISPKPTKIPFISTVFGEATSGTKLGAEYWWENIRKPVQFLPALEQLIADRHNIFVEIGSHPILANYLKEALQENNQQGAVIATLSRAENSAQKIIASARQIVLAGYDESLTRWFPARGNFVRLPNYAWQKERFWVKPTSESLGMLQRYYDHPLLGYFLQQQQNCWENTFDVHKSPWLADHRVGDSVVFPGAGFVESIIAAATSGFSGDVIEIEDFEIFAPLLLSEQSKLVRTRLQAETGKISIESRNQGEATNWTPHIRARILKQPTDNCLRALQLQLPTRSPDFNAAEHATITDRAGLHYGPAFQAINHGWAGKESAVALLNLPDHLTENADSFYIHPVLLDCGFQLTAHLLKGHQNDHDGIAYIPTRMDRFHFLTGQQAPTHATARITKKSPYSVTADFELFATDQQPVALCRGVRFKAIRLKKPVQHRLSYLDYHLTPVPGKGEILDTEPINRHLQKHVLPILEVWQQEPCNLQFTQEVEPLLESLVSAYITETLLPLTNEQGQIDRSVIERISDNADVSPLLNYLLSTAVSQGLIEPNEQGWRVSSTELEEVTADLIWNTLISEYPDYLQQILGVGRCGLHLQERLAGITATTELSPQDETYAHQFYAIHSKGFISQVTRQLNQVIVDCQQQIPLGQRLRVLEVSQDKPHFAEKICPFFDFHSNDFSFYSPSADAVELAQSLQKLYPNFQVLQPGGPGQVMAGSAGYQLAIIHLNFLTESALKSVLEDVRTLLAPGTLVVFSGLHRSNWIDFLLAVNSPHKPQLPMSFRQVSRLIEDQSLRLNINFNEPAQRLVGPYLLLAEVPPCSASTETITSCHQKWLLICSETTEDVGLAQSLAKELAAANQQVDILSAATSSALVSELTEPARMYDLYENIVHLHGFSLPDQIKRTFSRCEIAAKIFQFCESSETQQTLWLLTSGIAQLYPADQELINSGAGQATAPVTDAALWGFARTALHEAGKLSLKLTDVPQHITSESRTALLDEWLSPSSEDELCLLANGSRLAPRLRHEPPPAHSAAAEPCTEQNSAVSLTFTSPGQLRNLQWSCKPLPSATADELEIEVIATGLNFRDVMYALGLLSDEAVEDGYAGASLGLEFAGKVTQVGSIQDKFAVGDLVVGFGPACFSNRLLTKADAVARIPNHIDPLAAATIPTTFFTAYYALIHCARLQPGEKVLIHGAAGGVGIAAIQIAQWRGAEIYATAGSPEKRDFLKLLGVEHIYDSRALSFAEEILAQLPAGDGIDVVLNSLAGEAIQRNFRVLKPLGRFLEIGKRDFYENTEIGLRPFRNNISYFGIDADQLRSRSPELANRLFQELMALFEQGDLHPLPYTAFDALHVDEAFRYMQQARQIGKIVVTNYPELPIPLAPPVNLESEKVAFDRHGSYLVTGGTSGLGLSLADWLAERGAGTLLLISRSGEVSEEDFDRLADLQEKAVTVRCISCDVTDRAALGRVIDLCQDELPPLKGIIHAATTIEDGLIRNQTSEQIQSGMASKVLGAHYLHELTKDLPLDVFILLSSATTLFGNPGQSLYIAANHWLEALAANRRTQQLPATCVRLGAVADVGFLARNQEIKTNLQNRLGGESLTAEVVIDIIEKMLFHGSTANLGCLDFDWATLRRFLPGAAAPKFAEINAAVDEREGELDRQLDLQQLADELSTEELHAELVQLLKTELSEILLISESKIDPGSSLFDIGLDSLMGVELTAAVEEKLGIAIPVMLLSESPSINKLSSYIIKSLKGEENTAADSNREFRNIASQHGVATDSLQDVEDPTDRLDSEQGPQRIIKP